MAITSEQLTRFGDIVRTLEAHESPANIRHLMLPDIAALVSAEFGASYRWDRRTGRSEDGGYLNLYDGAAADFSGYFQHRDPISRLMREARRAVAVDEVIAPAELHRSEFWTDFLQRGGLCHGVNLFVFDGAEDLGDMRLWRGRDRPPFGRTELMLLDALAPHLARAILRQDRRYAGLTARESDVVHLVARGCRDQDIARVLGISFSTVRTHIGNAMDKRHCANRAELAASLRRPS